jgi:hypothetical protein
MRFPALPALLATALLVPILARADDGSPKHKITQSLSYVSLEPMSATVLDGDHPAGKLLVAIGLDIPDARLRENATRALPLLRDDYVRNLIAYAAAHLHPFDPPDADHIARRLQQVTDRALGRPGAQVLLVEVETQVNP